MAIIDLRLQHYRSYTDKTFELSPTVNIIVGPNASGKTNLLEAVLLIAQGSSYRAKDIELVQFGEPWSRLDARLDVQNEASEASGVSEAPSIRTVKLEALAFMNKDAVSKPAVKKSFVIAQKNYLRLSQQKMLPLVLFEPNHLLMLSGSPELRRSYLDELLEQIVPGFGTTRRQYRRVLAQRNALLKQGSDIATGQIFVWNVRLSELAGKIVRQRLDLIQQLNLLVGEVYSDISHTKATVKLEYLSPLSAHSNSTGNFAVQYESTLIRRYEQTLERDCLLGFTTAGPHRDDMQVLLNGHVSQEAASRGEVRTIILTLKILELQLLQAASAQPPILLLDDVFSELDAARREALTAFLQDYQTFITTTDADVVAKHFRGSSRLIELVEPLLLSQSNRV